MRRSITLGGRFANIRGMRPLPTLDNDRCLGAVARILLKGNT